MSNDRELLELAAKAAGLTGEWGEDISEFCDFSDLFLVDEYPWDPLEDDADALQLAVKLGINVRHFPESAHPFVVAYGVPSEYGCEELYGDDPLAATRRAIVRAAVELGRAVQ
jgi:hypothetical protein